MTDDGLQTFQPLPREFYFPSARVVARRLLGHYLLHRLPAHEAAGQEGGWCGGIIVETEAYLMHDPACHGFRKLTSRNAAMWGEAGRAYVYFIYGNYYCFNAVCRPAGCAEAVLIRAIEPSFGVELMQQRRPQPASHLANGPGKLCQAMELGSAQNHTDLTDPAGPVCIACNPGLAIFRRRSGPIMVTPRIGLTAAADWPLRFILAGSPMLSRRMGHR